MTYKKAIQTLREYNKWRRGELVKQPNPNVIGKAIDVVVDKGDFEKS